MSTFNEQFGTAVNKILNERGLSDRGMMIKSHSKINYSTINNMRKGIVPKSGVVIDFARALNEPINKWLVLAGYDPIPVELCLPEDMPSEIREEILRLLRSARGE